MERLLSEVKKPTVSRETIEQMIQRPDVKQGEKDLFRRLLDEAGEAQVNVKNFVDRVKSELLPLNVNEKSPYYKGVNYENITLPDELRGPVANYEERIYESPIKTSAGGVHYHSYDVPNYFAHTRIEDLPDNTTRRVVEAQSDLFQKGRLESEFPKEFSSLIPDIQKAFPKMKPNEIATYIAQCL